MKSSLYSLIPLLSFLINHLRLPPHETTSVLLDCRFSTNSIPCWGPFHTILLAFCLQSPAINWALTKPDASVPQLIFGAIRLNYSANRQLRRLSLFCLSWTWILVIYPRVGPNRKQLFLTIFSLLFVYSLPSNERLLIRLFHSNSYSCYNILTVCARIYFDDQKMIFR
jgi:hypothetical protein